MGRPKGSKNKPKILKSPFKPNEVPGVSGDPTVPVDSVAERVRYLAGRGLNANHIAILASVPVEDVSQGGKYWPDVEKGVALAILAVAETHYARVLAGKNTPEVVFYLKSVGKFAETAEGRKNVAAETGTSNEAVGLAIEFDDGEYDPDAPGEGENEDGMDLSDLSGADDDGDVEI